MLLKRTKPIPPSKIGVFSSCKLRYLLETEGNAANRLPAGPPANIGIAVHESIEALAASPELDIELGSEGSWLASYSSSSHPQRDEQQGC